VEGQPLGGRIGEVPTDRREGRGRSGDASMYRAETCAPPRGAVRGRTLGFDRHTPNETGENPVQIPTPVEVEGFEHFPAKLVAPVRPMAVAARARLDAGRATQVRAQARPLPRVQRVE
jgi:hypothetical protein